MVNWQVTATTILCARSGEEVTVIVYKDGTVKCTGEKSGSVNKSNQPDCQAASCPQTMGYLEKLMSEEAYG